MFKVRGCHGTVSTVDLPPSVPPEILKGMVELFRTLLHHELDTMVDGVSTAEPEDVLNVEH